MNRSAPGTIRYGVRLRKPAGTYGTAVVCFMVFTLLPISARRRARKPALGRSTRSTATRHSAASSGSAGTAASCGRARTVSTASSNRSVRSCSPIGSTHDFAKALHGAELELLHGALAPSHRRGDLPYRLLLPESHFDHAALVRRQLPHSAVEPRALLDALERRLGVLPPLRGRQLRLP